MIMWDFSWWYGNSRMGIQEMPKQFLLLGNKPLLFIQLKILLVPDVDVVYVAVHPNWVSYFNGTKNATKTRCA